MSNSLNKRVYNPTVYTSKGTLFYYSIELENTECRPINPYVIQEACENILTEKPLDITASGKSTFTIKTKAHKKLNFQLLDLKKIKCKATFHPRFNS